MVWLAGQASNSQQLTSKELWQKKHIADKLSAGQHTPATGMSHVNMGSVERILSAAGGGLLAYYGLSDKKLSKPLRIGLAALGSSLALRGAAGYCPVNRLLGRNSASKQNSVPKPLEIVQTFTVFRPVAEVYGFWRQLENLPRFMQHLESVEQLGGNRSRWRAPLPGGLGTLDWEAETVADEPNALLAWQSLPGSEVDNAGEVRFCPATKAPRCRPSSTTGPRPACSARV